MESTDTTAASCIACGKPVTESWLEKCPDYYLRTRHVVNYGACRNCGLVQQVPAPADTSSFYPSSYPMHSSRGPFLALARRLLIRNVYFVPPAGAVDGFLLDFGCGDGSYLESVRSRVGRRAGFEFSPAQAECLKGRLGCDVFCSIETAAGELAGQVDFVTAHFVLEHLSDLHATFRFWEKVLKPGGTLHLAVPNIRSWEAGVFRRKWHGLDPPRHVSFPDKESLRRLAAIYGLEPAEKRYGTFPNTLAASMATCLAGRYHHLLFTVLIPFAFLLASLLPHGTLVYRFRKSLSRRAQQQGGAA